MKLRRFPPLGGLTSDPIPSFQDEKLKEELDGLKKNMANGTNGTRGLVSVHTTHHASSS